jgi:hypothetical protein
MSYSGTTEEYRALAENDGALVKDMTDEQLLRHYLGTRLMIETDNPIFVDGAPTNQLRMGFVYQVDGLERAEILRRMRR